MITFEQFCKEHYPESLELYKRKTTPNYYECGVFYYPLRGGFGGTGKKYKKLLLSKCSLNIEGDPTDYILTDNEGNPYSCDAKNAFIDLQRVTEDVPYKKNIIDNGENRYLTTASGIYTIKYLIFRSYRPNRVAFRIVIHKENSPVWWEYYNLIGKGEPVLKTNKYKKHYLDMDLYDIEFKVPVRKMKEIVFGDPNTKIPKLRHQHD